jgi:hypothetical protein
MVIDMPNIYTVTCNHIATGEGHTVMILITRAYGPNDGTTNALNKFKEIFGEYYALGATVEEGLMLNKSYINLLISDRVRQDLMNWESDGEAPGGLEYFSSYHRNFS